MPQCKGQNRALTVSCRIRSTADRLSYRHCACSVQCTILHPTLLGYNPVCKVAPVILHGLISGHPTKGSIQSSYTRLDPPTRSGLPSETVAKSTRLSVTLSVGTPLRPYGMAYSAVYGVSSEQSCKKSLCAWVPRPQENANPPRTPLGP